LWLTLEAGTFEKITINTKSNSVRVTLSQADRFTANARLRVQGNYTPVKEFVNERDAFTIPLKRSMITIDLSHKKAQNDSSYKMHEIAFP
jgi:hypothetical protein